MNLNEFRKSLASPVPVYLLVTDQDYLKKKVFEWCRDQVQESARSFDWSVFDLETDSTVALVNQARTIPWMSPFRWIYVRNAEKADKLLEAYLKQPNSRTVMILESRKQVKEWGSIPIIEAGKDLNAVSWLVRKAETEGFVLDHRAALLLVDRLGEDLQKLDMELEKLMLCQWEQRKISLETVQEMVLDGREHDIFEMIGAIARRDRAEALRLLDRIYHLGSSPQQILSMLYWNFSRLLVAREMLEKGKPLRQILGTLKIWSYRGREVEIRRYSVSRLEQVLLQLREADRLLKSTGTDERIHLERVVIDTCRT